MDHGAFDLDRQMLLPALDFLAVQAQLTSIGILLRSIASAASASPALA
ncbi:MAG TPA: hypothetical protein VN648_31305 [Candidatus Methylomirabilis sp.]|nr:hypothetical protein [Candidatus Methylomirabilis sp.]